MSGKIALVLLSFIALNLSSTKVRAQDRCSTTKYEQQRKAKNPLRESPEQFEQWIQSRLSDYGNNPPQTTALYTIPVVVHVIHNGVNDVTHISKEQVESQIAVLNKDFNRLNLDAGNTPLEFLPVAGSLDIEFVLAKRTPEGLATDGITYAQGTKTQWSLSDQSEFKALSYWPAEDYLNIWVINFGSNDIGFAQFPVSNSLSGLEMASEDRLTDGVVVDYRAFGSSDAGSFPLFARFSKGRTATHEIGHFFGLRHIWGDDFSCDEDKMDFVSDTPLQNGPTTFCPSHPQVSCSANKMFMNYMDYTDDACMNVFTQGQVDRMLVIIGESPRRQSLTTSPGATPPILANNDLGIRTLLSPDANSCMNSITPSLEVRNYGSNAINSAQIQLLVNGLVTQTKDLILSLAPEQLTTILFDPFSPSTNNYEVSFQITQTNLTTDGNSENNSASVSVSAPSGINLPVIEGFSAVPPGWTIYNPDNQITWANVIAPDNSPVNRAMKMNFYDYQNEGVLDWVITPAFSMTIPSIAQLRFDLAYAQYSGQTGDALKVYALRGCNRDLTQAILLYDKADAALATAPATSLAFVPTNASQWRKSEVVSLAPLTGTDPWQLAFVGKNGYGNNLYLDNIVVTQDDINDIALVGVVSPGIVHCLSNPVIKFQVSNLGTTLVSRFTMNYSVNGAASQVQLFTNIQLDIGETETFSLNAISLQPGVNQVILTVSLPNDIPDILTNNVFHLTSVLDQSVDKGPLRVTFDNPKEKSWRVASPADALDWESISTNKDKSLTYRSFSNSEVGQESWLASPVLDLTAGTFSLFFDVSYAQNMPADDRLQILASTDCGEHYDQVIMDRGASTFTTASSSSEWYPGSNDDWRREYANIASLAGLDNVRIAFVALNDNGNNLFIDNIEMFSGSDSNPPVTPVVYQVYYSDRNSQSDVAITFNLSERQDVPLQVLSMQGALVAEYTLPETLNQTHYFDLSGIAAGLYLFRLMIDNQPFVTKVFIGH